MNERDVHFFTSMGKHLYWCSVWDEIFDIEDQLIAEWSWSYNI